jgi:hypothetical protein
MADEAEDATLAERLVALVPPLQANPIHSHGVLVAASGAGAPRTARGAAGAS